MLALAYSALILLQQQPKAWDWFNTLAATGISFFLALIAGIYLFNLQTMATRTSENEDLRILLTAELSDLQRILNDSNRMGLDFPSGKKIDVLITYIQPLVIEKAALSGLFTVTESENLLHIARKIRTYNLKTQYFLSLLPSRSSESTFLHAYENLEQSRVAIISNIGHVAIQLNLNFSKPDRVQ
ncbi:hypothetical protein D3C85_1228930 [compost metagenome]